MIRLKKYWIAAKRLTLQPSRHRVKLAVIMTRWLWWQNRQMNVSGTERTQKQTYTNVINWYLTKE